MEIKQLYQNKEWLKKKYLNERLSLCQIAKISGVNFSTIHKWMVRFNIPRRSIGKAMIIQSNSENANYHNKKWLRNKYIDEKLSTFQIAELVKIGQPTIWYWLKKFDIPHRSHSEANHLSQANHCNLTRKAVEWINGELLGDGCLCSNNNYSARFSYTSKYLEYAQYISDTLKSFGIKQVGKINKMYHERLDCYSYHYDSRRYVELLPIRKHWYPKGKKIIPKDIKLTPLICRQLYIGEGCLHRLTNVGRPYIRLATCGFVIEDIEWLVKQLMKLGFKVKRQPSSNTIRISAFSTKDFLDYIGKCPVECYQYKFRY